MVVMYGFKYYTESKRTVGEENGKKVKMFWIIDILEVVCTCLPESSTIQYPSFTVCRKHVLSEMCE